MADLTTSSTVRQGNLVMDPRITADSIWAAESTGLTQAGPVPGVPVPQRATRAVLKAHGQQAANTGLRILAHDTGSVWRGSSDATTRYRGWNPPHVLSSYEPLRYLTGLSAPALEAVSPHLRTLPDGSVVAVYQLYRTSPTTEDVVQCQVRDPDTGLWGAAVDIEALGYAYGSGRAACATVCVLPAANGAVRLVCFYLVEIESALLQVRSAYSDDQGATWTTASVGCLADGIAYEASTTPSTAGTVSEVTRMRAEYKDGQVLLVISAREADTDPDAAITTSLHSRDVLRQYASYDLGLTVQTIAIGSTTLPGYTGRYADLCVSGGYFWLAYVSVFAPDETLGAHTRVIKLGSAGQRFDRTESIEIGGGASGTVAGAVVTTNTIRRLTDGDCAIVASDTGEVYVIERIPATGYSHTLVTEDQGRTWSYMGIPGGYTVGADIQGAWWSSATLHGYDPTEISATWQRGRAVVGFQTSGDWLGCAYLGGYTTASMPRLRGYSLPGSVASLDEAWVPMALPGAMQFTSAGAGTEAISSAGALNLQTVANAINYNHDLATAGNIAGGFILVGTVQVVSGGSTSTDAVAVKLRLADGVSDYEASIRFSTTAIALYDVNGAANVDTLTIDTLTTGVDFMLWMGGGGKVRTFFRLRSTNEDGAWTVGPAGTVTNDGATPAADHLWQWGHVSNGTAESNWWFAGAGGNGGPSYSLTTIADAAASWTNPTDLYPRRWWPDPVYVDGGTAISQRGGPPFPGDSWHIDTRYLYGVERMFPATVASPLVGWRSVADGSDMYIALDLDTGLTAEHYPECDTIGLMVLGANWRSGELQGYDTGTAAWVTIGAIDAAGGPTGARFQSLGAVRLGNTLRPNTSATDKPWVSRDELVGWTVDMAGTTKRRIIGNSAGRWDSAYPGERPTIIMAGVEAGDPATPSIRLYPPDFVTVFNLLGATYAGYRLKITAQDTVDGDYRIGSMLLGPVLINGYEPAWGSSSEIEDLTEAEERADGSIQSRSLGKPRRIYEWGWDEIDETRISGAAADPDYRATSTSSGALPTASLQDTVASMVGTYRRLLGRHSLCCVLRTFPTGSTGADVKTINRWSHFIYGRITSPLRVANVLGRHGENEVVRLSNVTLTEER